MRVERHFRLMVKVEGENPSPLDFLNGVRNRFEELTRASDLDDEFVLVEKREWEDADGGAA